MEKLKIGVIYDLAWYPEAAVSYFVSLFSGVPYVLHVHAADYFEDRRGFLNTLKYNRLRGRIKNLTFKGAKRVITVSNFTKKTLVDDGLDGSKITVIPNGIDPSHFKPQLNARDLVLKYGLENKKILLTVSRLDDYKGHDMVLKTLPRLISKFPDIKYIIVGEGSYEKHLRKLVDELNLNNYVVFTGWVDESMLPLYYNACDVFIMLSRENREAGLVEGFGIVFLEAMESGLPVISKKTGGVVDIIVEGTNGYLIDANDFPIRAASKIQKMIENPQLYSYCSRNALELVKNYDIKLLGRKLVKDYLSRCSACY